MMEDPTCPGVGEYLYQAASLVRGGSLRGGTWMVPFRLSPTYSSRERTPIAGIEIETGSDRARVGDGRAVVPRAVVDRGAGVRAGAAMTPAWSVPGWGACCWAAAAPPSTLPPPAISTTPAAVATIRPVTQPPLPRRPGILSLGIPPANSGRCSATGSCGPGR